MQILYHKYFIFCSMFFIIVIQKPMWNNSQMKNTARIGSVFKYLSVLVFWTPDCLKSALKWALHTLNDSPFSSPHRRAHNTTLIRTCIPFIRVHLLGECASIMVVSSAGQSFTCSVPVDNPPPLLLVSLMTLTSGVVIPSRKWPES